MEIDDVLKAADVFAEKFSNAEMAREHDGDPLHADALARDARLRMEHAIMSYAQSWSDQQNENMRAALAVARQTFSALEECGRSGSMPGMQLIAVDFRKADEKVSA